jgi:hypothetical protein
MMEILKKSSAKNKMVLLMHVVTTKTNQVFLFARFRQKQKGYRKKNPAEAGFLVTSSGFKPETF